MPLGHIHPTQGYYLYQYIFIIYGSFTVVWGIILFFVLPDSPVTCWFLNHEERIVAVARTKRNQTGMINRSFKREQLRETLIDVKTWWYFLFAFFANVPGGGLNAYVTTIIGNFGFNPLNTVLLAMPWGAMATLGNIIAGLVISFTVGKRLHVIGAFVIPPLIGEVMQYLIPHTQKGPSLFAYYLTGVYNAPYVMSLALMGSNVAGTTKKTVTAGLVWVAYCTGQISGPFFFRAQDAPQYNLGIAACLTSFAIQILMAVGFRLYLGHLNRRKDSFLHANNLRPEDESAEHAFSDLTDIQVSGWLCCVSYA